MHADQAAQCYMKSWKGLWVEGTFEGHVQLAKVAWSTDTLTAHLLVHAALAVKRTPNQAGSSCELHCNDCGPLVLHRVVLLLLEFLAAVTQALKEGLRQVKVAHEHKRVGQVQAGNRLLLSTPCCHCSAKRHASIPEHSVGAAGMLLSVCQVCWVAPCNVCCSRRHHPCELVEAVTRQIKKNRLPSVSDKAAAYAFCATRALPHICMCC